MNGKKKSDNQSNWWSNYKWIPIVLGILGIAIVACVYWCGGSPPDLATVLSEEYGADPKYLSLNFPPSPLMYPGTVLLAPLDIFLDSVDSTDPSLAWGSPHTFVRKFSGNTEGSSQSLGKLFEIAANSQAKVEFEFKSINTRVVDRPTLIEHVKSLAMAGDIADGAPANVICRSFEGELEITIKQQRSFLGSTGAWNDLIGDLKSSGVDSTKIKFSTKEKEEVRWTFLEPVVFAFEACRASSLILNGKIDLAPPAEAVTDPHQAVEALMKFDPATLEDVPKILREIGPGVDEAVQDAIRSKEPEAKERGEVLLRNMPDQFRPQLVDPQSSLNDQDPKVRAWSVLELSESASDNNIQLLAGALDDSDPTVRFLASQSLGELGHRANVASPALQNATTDSDPDVRLSAAAALIVVEANQGGETTAVETAITASDAGTRVAAVTVMGNQFLPVQNSLPLLRQSLADPDLSVKLATLKSIGKLGSAAGPLIPAVKRLLHSRNPKIKRAARTTLSKIQQP